MARKRTYKKRNTGKRAQATRKQASKIDLAIVILMVLAILLGVLIYTKSGVIGIKLSEILGGLMGIIRYVLPIGIFAIAIKIACEDRDVLKSKLIQYTIFLISIMVLMSTLQISSGELTYTKELSEVVKDAYNIGMSGTGGGAIGAVLAVPLVKLLGTIGAIIACVGVAVVLLVFMFGINTSDMINDLVEKSQDKREEKLERRRAYKEEMQKNREEEMAERAELREEKRRAKEEKELERQRILHTQVGTDDEPEQIKINFGGRIVEDEPQNKRKKYNHENDDLTPLTKETKVMLQK